MADLSVGQARRIALAAQGFADPVPGGPPTRRHFRRVLGRTRLLQMDSVNILARAHYLPAFSRLGAYDDTLLDTAAWRDTTRSPRLLAEYWAHEAALIPVDDWPLFGWRMDDYRGGRYRYTREVLARNRSLAADVRDVIVGRGASTPRSVEDELGIERTPGEKGSWWTRGEVKHVCEALFASGDLSATRNGNFVRHYDLAERIVGDQVNVSIPRAEAHRELVTRAAAAHGVGTVADLADYYRLKTADVKAVLPDLLDAGIVREVSIDGWGDRAYLHRDARIPRKVRRSTLLSPFDPLVFFRPRTQRLFDFHYRIEIYVPEHKRVHGYYVLPYLMDEQVAARVDLKADRSTGVLHVLSAHVEPGVDQGEVAERLAADLRATAAWRGLDDVVIHGRGELSGALSAVS
ncbi:winged helix DNA-binding domain-containing protein [Gordonia sp. HY002]|uniref:winged helix-turn-helix domain-containing protein n=1 Tax=Gordonia zhenghanii TaxID=2911516 RepID=UPI001EF0E665|nr:crosslink repair DNA glycosylase YcaQ family protein [Gordonia zhenghanii]MCF8569606.1 winged helix DNA-binding domain-containing protein [Gordonia zhenghanii]MCF8602873.1 winged helix DNA-binding domain-containing protein [Gordonia zhenghanii]